MAEIAVGPVRQDLHQQEVLEAPRPNGSPLGSGMRRFVMAPATPTSNRKNFAAFPMTWRSCLRFQGSTNVPSRVSTRTW